MSHSVVSRNLTQELEALKESLIRMRPDEFEARSFEAVRREISAIRLQLKRLELDRVAMQDEVSRMHPPSHEPSAQPPSVN